ncbi:aminoglycoside 6'-N-acetyltransferase [Ornithinibacillus contaminans]|uniref:aminoglycoside 6'-N-acetyltransferase n=1 Tax=Ornithinibacillus contaminans TaxID=694055 RepID=UPI00191C0CF6|nr:aminoglycoside 6'-N-acetyltransferase [Ornithinibacillus contaminans]
MMGTIIEVKEEHVEDLTRLTMELWPGHDVVELTNEYKETLKTDNNKFYLYIENGVAVAFMHLSIRVDYVEGSESSPTGYLEGVYVQPDYRRKGISTELFNEGKSWLKENGCKQIGSDMEMDNQDSYPFHMSLGFNEAGRIITFIRDIE